MVSNVSNRLLRGITIASDHVCHVSLVNLNVVAICQTEGLKLHVVSISTSASHLLQVSFKDAVDVCLRGGHKVMASVGIASSIFPLGIASKSTAGVHVNEVLEVVRVLTQVLDDAGADLVVGALCAVDLV